MTKKEREIRAAADPGRLHRGERPARGGPVSPPGGGDCDVEGEAAGRRNA